MPKKIMVVPEKVRQHATLKIREIPVNAYKSTVSDEIKSGSDVTLETCLRVYRDMALIREFETMLDNIKKLGAYRGIEYSHAGPAHLSIGQEGAAVGEALHLTVDDHVYGSHRSHGEFIAKGLRAVQDLAGGGLEGIMTSYFGGATLKVVEANEPDWTGLSLTPAGKKKALM